MTEQDDQQVLFRGPAPARCSEWFPITEGEYMPRAGRWRSRRSPPRSTARRRRCMSVVKKAEARQWCARRCSHGCGDKAEGSGNARTASFGRPTRSCARRARILPRRSSTAGSGHDCLHRRLHRQAHGLSSRFCRGKLLIALSTYHAHVAKRVDPSRLSARDRRDAGRLGRGGPARV